MQFCNKGNTDICKEKFRVYEERFCARQRNQTLKNGKAAMFPTRLIYLELLRLQLRGCRKNKKMQNRLTGLTPDTIESKLTLLKKPGKLNLGGVEAGDAGEARRYFWAMNVPPGYGEGAGGRDRKHLFFPQKIWGWWR